MTSLVKPSKTIDFNISGLIASALSCLHKKISAAALHALRSFCSFLERAFFRHDYSKSYDDFEGITEVVQDLFEEKVAAPKQSEMKTRNPFFALMGEEISKTLEKFAPFDLSEVLKREISLLDKGFEAAFASNGIQARVSVNLPEEFGESEKIEAHSAVLKALGKAPLSGEMLSHLPLSNATVKWDGRKLSLNLDYNVALVKMEFEVDGSPERVQEIVKQLLGKDLFGKLIPKKAQGHLDKILPRVMPLLQEKFNIVWNGAESQVSLIFDRKVTIKVGPFSFSLPETMHAKVDLKKMSLNFEEKAIELSVKDFILRYLTVNLETGTLDIGYKFFGNHKFQIPLSDIVKEKKEKKPEETPPLAQLSALKTSNPVLQAMGSKLAEALKEHISPEALEVIKTGFSGLDKSFNADLASNGIKVKISAWLPESDAKHPAVLPADPKILSDMLFSNLLTSSTRVEWNGSKLTLIHSSELAEVAVEIEIPKEGKNGMLQILLGEFLSMGAQKNMVPFLSELSDEPFAISWDGKQAKMSLEFSKQHEILVGEKLKVKLPKSLSYHVGFGEKIEVHHLFPTNSEDLRKLMLEGASASSLRVRWNGTNMEVSMMFMGTELKVEVEAVDQLTLENREQFMQTVLTELLPEAAARDLSSVISSLSASPFTMNFDGEKVVLEFDQSISVRVARIFKIKLPNIITFNVNGLRNGSPITLRDFKGKIGPFSLERMRSVVVNEKDHTFDISYRFFGERTVKVARKKVSIDEKLSKYKVRLVHSA